MSKNIYIATLLALFTGCSDKSFSGDNKAKSPDSGPTSKVDKDGSDPGDPNSSNSAACDLSKDSVKINFPAAIKKCADGGKIYDFARNVCTDMPAKSDCSYDAVLTQIADLNFNREKIETSMVNAANQLPFKTPVTLQTLKTRAKLVSCGTSPDGRSVVAQWWFVPASGEGAASCNYSSALNILTVCYRNYKDGEIRPAPATTSAEHAKIVSDCLQRL